MGGRNRLKALKLADFLEKEVAIWHEKWYNNE